MNASEHHTEDTPKTMNRMRCRMAFYGVITYRVFRWSFLWVPILLAYIFLSVVEWIGEKAWDGKLRLRSFLENWEPYKNAPTVKKLRSKGE